MEKKLLIVDDNTSICKILSDFLKNIEDIKICDICHNGIDATKSIQEFKPDIILLDLIMPELDGLGVLKFLNEHSFEKTKVIILSAIGQDNILKEAFLYGAQYYMIKPFNLKSLEDRIRLIMRDDEPLIKNNNFDETKIKKHIIDIGIPTNILGYRYINESLKNILGKSESWLVTDLYKSIAEKNFTSEQCVENAIRNAVSRAYKKNNDLYQKLFPKNFYDRKPSNSLFLTVLAEYLKMEIC